MNLTPLTLLSAKKSCAGWQSEEARKWLDEANSRAATELDTEDLPWNRASTLKVLREETDAMMDE